MHTALVLTHDCNLACTYCYTGEKFRREMDLTIALRGLDLAFAGIDAVDLAFFGGEPLICFETLVHLAQIARDRAGQERRALRLSVTTNATLLTVERARVLADLGFDVAVSLDGIREAHEAGRPQRGGRSSFDATVRGVLALQSAGIALDVIAVVTPANVRHLGASVRFLSALGARSITLNPTFEAAWSDDELALWERGLEDAAETYAARMREGRPLSMPAFDDKLLAAVKGGLAACDGCGAGTREIAVAPSGALYPCARLVGEDRDPRWRVGHLDTGIDRVAVAALRAGPSDPACGECAEQWRCSATCACANIAETGNAALPGGLQCWYERTRARIADAISHSLLETETPSFVDWTYGRVARAAAATESIRRVRRLPILARVA